MGNSLRIIVLALLAYCCVGTAVQAQEFPPVYVLTEEDDEEFRTCQVSNASIKATVESELSFNRVPVGTREQAVRGEALRAYIEVIPLVVSGECAVSHRISLGNYQRVVLSVTEKKIFAMVEICIKAGLLSGPSDKMQSSLNAVFRDFTSQCIAEYWKNSERGNR